MPHAETNHSRHNRMMPRRVFVSGAALIAGGSDSTRKIWDALRADSVLDQPAPEDGRLAELAEIPSGDASILARHQLLALAVAEKAWSLAGLPSARNRLRGEGPKTRHPRIGCVAGTSSGNLAAMESELPAKKFHPYAITRWRGNSVGAAVALRFGLGGCDFSINAASGTGAQAAFLAATVVRHGLADAVVAVAADPLPTPRLLRAMESNHSVAPGNAARPLGPGRRGMSPAEGSACLIFESEEHAASRGAQPLTEWLDGAAANESHHLLAPEPSANVLSELIENLLHNHPRPDWVSLHATGTPRFDAVEVDCFKRVFGSALPWISAIKRTTGHALGASGLIEAALVCEGLRRGEVPQWPADTDPALGLEALRPEISPLPRVALQLGQGMGGAVAANVFSAAGSVP
jgi:3-oxoacyl-(acyl-carrier-protein) synthase